MKETTLGIDVANLVQYKFEVQARIRRWHEEEWHSMAWNDFCALSNGSFLFNINRILESADEDGNVDLIALQEVLKRELGEYYSEDKFDKAIAFVQSNDWDSLLIP